MADGGLHERVVAQNGAATHQGVTDSTFEALAFVDRIPGARHHVAALQGPLGLKIDERHVSIQPGRDAALGVAKTHDAGGVGCSDFNNPLQRQSPFVVPFAEQNWKQRFQSRAAGRSRPYAAGLGGDIAMNVIGRDRINLAVAQALPEPFTVRSFAQRRIDLADIAAGQPTSCVR